jgi:hypothetical protein
MAELLDPPPGSAVVGTGEAIAVGDSVEPGFGGTAVSLPPCDGTAGRWAPKQLLKNHSLSAALQFADARSLSQRPAAGGGTRVAVGAGRARVGRDCTAGRTSDVAGSVGRAFDTTIGTGCAAPPLCPLLTRPITAARASAAAIPQAPKKNPRSHQVESKCLAKPPTQPATHHSTPGYSRG